MAGNTRFDAALVDLDGTLVDTLGDFVAAINAMLTDLQLPVRMDTASIETLVGKGSENLIHSVLKVAQSRMDSALSAIKFEADSEGTFDAAFASYQAHYATINGQYAHVYAGAREGLQALREAGLTLICLTNKPVLFARALLQAKGLDGFFAQVYGGDSFARKKPDPMPLREACAFAGSTPARTLMIGDSSNDAQAARAAGCPVWLLTYGYNHGEPVRSVDADGFADRLDTLVATALAN